MQRVEALVNPALLKWARKTAHMREDEAARRADVRAEDLADWEEGRGRPTIRQAERLAEAYRRPLAAFYLDAVPTDFAVIKDLRRVQDPSGSKFPPDLVLLIRDLQGRQEWARSELAERGETRLEFVGSFPHSQGPAVIANSIRATLRISAQEQFSFRSFNDALNAWIAATERAGVFVCQSSRNGRISIEDARGLALTNDIAPFIWLNSRDSLAARIFSLAHELAHIWLGETGVSGMSPPTAATREGQVETLCNAIAAGVLLPPALWRTVRSELPNHSEIESWIDWASRATKLSREFIARCALDDGSLSQRKYRALRAVYINEAQSAEPGGGGNWYVNQSRAIGKAFIRLVSDSYARNRITGSTAAALLDTKVNNIPRLSAQAEIAEG